MKVKGTPVIVRETNDGKIIAICPTIPGRLDDGQRSCLSINAKHDWSKSADYDAFMSTTAKVSRNEAKKFIEVLASKWDGCYTYVTRASNKMHEMRKSNNNVETIPHCREIEY